VVRFSDLKIRTKLALLMALPLLGLLYLSVEQVADKYRLLSEDRGLQQLATLAIDLQIKDWNSGEKASSLAHWRGYETKPGANDDTGEHTDRRGYRQATARGAGTCLPRGGPATGQASVGVAGHRTGRGGGDHCGEPGRRSLDGVWLADDLPGGGHGRAAGAVAGRATVQADPDAAGAVERSGHGGPAGRRVPHRVLERPAGADGDLARVRPLLQHPLRLDPAAQPRLFLPEGALCVRPSG